MSTPILSSRTPPAKSNRDKARRAQQQAEETSIPPELLLRRDRALRFEKDGPVYATDGKVGVLKKVVVDDEAGEVTEIAVLVDGNDRLVMLPTEVVDKSAGSALFLTLNYVQFAERAASGPYFVKNQFAKVDLKSLAKRDPERQTLNPRRSVATAGPTFVETPTISPLDRIQRKPATAAAD
jgi:hypothetical protein